MAQIEETETCYPITSNQRRENGYQGIGLAIVNSFHDFPNMRVGAKQDKETLSQLFESLNLEYRPHYEKTKEQIVELLEETAKDPNLSSDSMIAIAISSHGCEEGLLGINIQNRLKYGGDSDYKNTEDCISSTQIQEIFNGDNCKGLAGKPKLFLLNGCRGKGVENAVRKEKITFDGIESTPDGIESTPDSEYATTWSDFFVIHSCVHGKISLLSNIEGSLFFVEFSKTYAKYGHKRPIESIMPTVNRNLIKVCKMKGAKSPQCCTWESTCTQLLLIPPREVKMKPTKQPVYTHHQLDPFSTMSMSSPCGLVVAESGEIFVTDPPKNCIWVFPPGGIQAKDQDIPYKQFHLPENSLANCSGICIKDDFLFVSCNNQIMKLSSTTGETLTCHYTETSTTGLDINDNDRLLYVCEQFTCKILFLDMNLNIVKDKLALSPLNPSKNRLLDIKVFPDAIYVLITGTQAAIQMFDLKGHYITDIVSSQHLEDCHFFTMDRENRTVYAGDSATSKLKKFRNIEQADCTQTVCGDHSDDLGKIKGIDLDANKEVVFACIFNSKCKLCRMRL